MSENQQRDDTDRTLARSRAYALFAEAFSFPQGDAVIRLLDGDLIAELRQALSLMPYGITVPDELALPATKNAIQEMQIIYTGLFDVTGGTPKVSLLERRYCDTPEQALWEELLRFYTHFGLDFSNSDIEEQPDHMLTELGFMHYLTFLEAGCKDDKNRKSIRRGQRDFLTLHLGTMMEPVATNLVKQSAPNPYGEFGRVALELIRCDEVYLSKILPKEISQEPTEH